MKRHNGSGVPYLQELKAIQGFCPTHLGDNKVISSEGAHLILEPSLKARIEGAKKHQCSEGVRAFMAMGKLNKYVQDGGRLLPHLCVNADHLRVAMGSINMSSNIAQGEIVYTDLCKKLLDLKPMDFFCDTQSMTLEEYISTAREAVYNAKGPPDGKFEALPRGIQAVYGMNQNTKSLCALTVLCIENEISEGDQIELLQSNEKSPGLLGLQATLNVSVFMEKLGLRHNTKMFPEGGNKTHNIYFDI